MAGPPPIALLLGAAAAILMLRKKDEPTPDSDHPDLPNLDDGDKPSATPPEVPDVKSQEELQAELDAETEATKAQVRAALQWKLLPSGYDIPNDMDHGWIWVSDDCEASAIGRDWKPILKVGDKLYSPSTFWTEFADGVRPNEAIGNNKGSSAASHFTRQVILQNDDEIECSGELPNPSDFDNNEDYGNAWTDVRNAYPALAELYDKIYGDIVGKQMMGAWYEADPQAYIEYQIERIAKWAHQNYSSYSVTDQTDEAYKNFTDTFDVGGEGKDAPAVLDPDNPEHESYIQLWLDLRDAIQDL